MRSGKHPGRAAWKPCDGVLTIRQYPRRIEHHGGLWSPNDLYSWLPAARDHPSCLPTLYTRITAGCIAGSTHFSHGIHARQMLSVKDIATTRRTALSLCLTFFEVMVVYRSTFNSGGDTTLRQATCSVSLVHRQPLDRSQSTSKPSSSTSKHRRRFVPDVDKDTNKSECPLPLPLPLPPRSFQPYTYLVILMNSM